MVSVSFEFYPPKTPEGLNGLMDEARMLATLEPSLMTVTFGAGGSAREGTVKTISGLKSVTQGALAAHITYICLTKSDLKEYLGHLWGMGIRHLVALRGDLPKDHADVRWPLDADPNYYQYTSDFVAGIKSLHDFKIDVGAYPEKHPDAPSPESDIA